MHNSMIEHVGVPHVHIDEVNGAGGDHYFQFKLFRVKSR